MYLATLALFADAVVSSVSPPSSRPPAEPAFRLSCDRGCLSPIEAVTYASYLGDKAGVAGMFDMPVAEVGQQNGLFYLNSEADYRDRNCLTVALTPAAMLQLVGTNDLDRVRKRLRGHRVIVRGVAQRQRIDFTSDGKPSGKFYYQIHVRVSAASQIRVTT